MKNKRLPLLVSGVLITLFGCVEFDKQIPAKPQPCDARMLGVWYNVDTEYAFEFLHIYSPFPAHKVYGYASIRHQHGADKLGQANTGALYSFRAGDRLFVQATPDDKSVEHGPIYQVEIKPGELRVRPPSDSAYEEAVKAGVLKGTFINNEHSPVRMKITSPEGDVINWLKDLPDRQFDRPDVYRRFDLNQLSPKGGKSEAP